MQTQYTLLYSDPMKKGEKILFISSINDWNKTATGIRLLSAGYFIYVINLLFSTHLAFFVNLHIVYATTRRNIIC